MNLDLGRDLATPRLSWRRLRLIIERLDDTSALYLEQYPEHHGWNMTAHLLAAVVDSLTMGNWQRGGDKHRPKPKPTPRPDEKPKSTSYGTTVMTMAEADAWLAGDSYTTTANDLFV